MFPVKGVSICEFDYTLPEKSGPRKRKRSPSEFQDSHFRVKLSLRTGREEW